MRILTILTALLVIFTCLVTTVEAGRFGGGRSFGMQRSFSSRSFQQPSSFAANAAAPRRSWVGPLAGLAAGGLLASLFMGHGFGSGILSWLLVGGIAFFIWNLFRARRPAFSPQINSHFQPVQNTMSSASFDVEAFLRTAKVNFIRLQAAYDIKNLDDIRQFTTPEVFAEIQLQLQERNENVLNQTEVVTLNANLIDVVNDASAPVASVQFTGLIRENPQDAANALSEIWHFKKSGSNWLVAGIQQQ